MDVKKLTNDIIAGKHRADLMLVTTATTEERTAATIAITKTVALEHEIPMVIFSLELSNARLLAHLLADSAQHDVIEVLESKQANGQLQQVLDAIKNKPLYIDNTPGLSTHVLREKASKLVKEYGVQVILIDYLELVESYETADMNDVAQELGVQLIAMSSK